MVQKGVPKNGTVLGLFWTLFLVPLLGPLLGPRTGARGQKDPKRTPKGPPFGPPKSAPGSAKKAFWDPLGPRTRFFQGVAPNRAFRGLALLAKRASEQALLGVLRTPKPGVLGPSFTG